MTTENKLNREQRIAVLEAISKSTKTIKKDNGESIIVFDYDTDTVRDLFMDVLDPWKDYTYEWTASALEQAVTALKADEFDTFADSDELNELVDSMCDVYNNDLLEWARHNMDEVDEALKEDGGESGFYSSCRVAQCRMIDEHVRQVFQIVADYIDGAEE